MRSLRALPSSMSFWRASLLELAFHGGGVVVALFALVLELPKERDALVVEADDEVGVGLHEAVGDVLLDRGEVVLDELVVEHAQDNSRRAATGGKQGLFHDVR